MPRRGSLIRIHHAAEKKEVPIGIEWGIRGVWGRGAEEELGQVLGSRVACTRRNCNTTGGPRSRSANLDLDGRPLSLSLLSFALGLSLSLCLSAMLALWVGSSLGHVYKLKVCNHISHVAREPEDSDLDLDLDWDDCVAALSPDVDFGRSFVSLRPPNTSLALPLSLWHLVRVSHDRDR